MPSLFSSPTPAVKFCGVTYTESAGLVVYLPLEQLDVHAEIVDVSATVTLTQTFWQCSPLATPRAKYVFPVPAQAAVCGFEMRTEDGRVLAAVAKEKEAARREHEHAIQAGRMTGLVEHVSDDVFTVSLGCLPQLQMITTKLTYVMDLLEDDFMDQIRFQLPVSVGMRYGTPPSGMVAARTIPANRIQISVDVFMKGGIQSMISPTHPTFELSDAGTESISARVARQTGRYHSPSFLSADFVLSIKSEGLNTPRCFAERGATGTVAMQLTVVPQFKFPPMPAQEYIFLVDRSGSMGGARIETAKRGLVMLLRSLPSQGTSFNILSFGSRVQGLWPRSMPYNQDTLAEATNQVDAMAANYGGTEIRLALDFMFNSRQQNTPTSCFVLTDGEAWDIDQTISSVVKATYQAKADAPLRVFTLGIGETTSSALCNGIARAGKGICLMAATSEAIIAKCSKLVKASRTEILDNVTVDWRVPAQSLEALALPSNQQTMVLRQGPKTLPPLYSGARFVSFAIVQHPQFAIPQEVTVRATRGSTGEQFAFTVPVEVLDTESGAGGGPQRPLIHTLAARRVIMDMEDGEKGDVSPAVKAAIVHLGEQYQLASRFTSFVAVEGPNQEKLDPTPGDAAQVPTTPNGPLPHIGALFGGGHGYARALPGGSRSATFGAQPQMFGASFGASATPSPAALRATGLQEMQFSSQQAQLQSMQRQAQSVQVVSQPTDFQPRGGARFAHSPSAPPSPYRTPQTMAFGGSAPAVHAGVSLRRNLLPSSSPPVQHQLPAEAVSPIQPQSMDFRAQSSLFGLSPPAAAAPPPPGMALPAMAGASISDNDYQQMNSADAGLRPHGLAYKISAPVTAGTQSLFGSNNTAHPAQPRDDVERLVRLQSFDGSFSVSEELAQILGRDALRQAQTRQVDAKVWATVLAIAYLQKHLRGQPELLEGLVEKASTFVEQAYGDDFSALLQAAEALV